MFLFDTYAIIEIIKGNESYKKYLDSEAIVNKFILAELSYWLIRNQYSEKIDFYIDKYAKAVKSANIKTLKEAMEFRYEHKQKKMSMTDCISYLQAKELGIKFLTGDKEFENLENVEFVK